MDYFNNLPKEMLEAIFANISDPQDKMVLLRTFPMLESLMRWDEGTLYFEMIYPLIYSDVVHDWRDRFNLCKVSPAVKDIVLNHFCNLMTALPQARCSIHSIASQIEEGEVIECMHFDTGLHETIAEVEQSENSEWPWINNMPFLFGLQYNEYIQGYQNKRQSIQEFLTRYGARFLDVWFEILGQTEEDEVAKFIAINEVLENMPNLRYLGGYDTERSPWWGYIAHNCGGKIKSAGNDQRLPNMRLFKYLRLSGITPFLDSRGIANNMPFLEEVWVDDYLPPFPNYDQIFRTYFWNSPLKYVKYDKLEGNQNQLPAFLLLLSHFGGTLEKLEIDCRIEVVEGVDSSYWPLLDLPKLHFFQITDYKLNLDFLLKLPALQTLSIENCQAETETEGFSTGILKLPWREDRKYDTRIWKYIPSLKSLQVCERRRNDDGENENKFGVTRYEYEKYMQTRIRRSFLGSLFSWLF